MSDRARSASASSARRASSARTSSSTACSPGERRRAGTAGRRDRAVLADRLPATHYHSFDPGVTATSGVERRIVGELERQRVEYVLLSTVFDHVREPNRSGETRCVVELGACLRSRYALCRVFDVHLTLWRRRHPVLPGSAPLARARLRACG